MSNNSLVQFFKLIDSVREPKRADRSAAGYLPSRAMRYCDALTSATGFGYWIFPPMTFRLIWDGERILWSFGEDDPWMPLTESDSGAVQYPEFSDVFDNAVPADLQGYAPPFLTAMPEVGGVQIWSGLLVKTRPGWSLNVRAPVNLPPIPGLAAWEGIVETDVWFGPLFNNFRILRTNEPVVFRAGIPFMQVQPIPQIAYRDDNLNDFTCSTAADVSNDDWNKLGELLLPNPDREARQGKYAVTVRKRRTCPVHRDAFTPAKAAD